MLRFPTIARLRSLSYHYQSIELTGEKSFHYIGRAPEKRNKGDVKTCVIGNYRILPTNPINNTVKKLKSVEMLIRSFRLPKDKKFHFQIKRASEKKRVFVNTKSRDGGTHVKDPPLYSNRKRHVNVRHGDIITILDSNIDVTLGEKHFINNIYPVFLFEILMDTTQYDEMEEKMKNTVTVTGNDPRQQLNSNISMSANQMIPMSIPINYHIMNRNNIGVTNKQQPVPMSYNFMNNSIKLQPVPLNFMMNSGNLMNSQPKPPEQINMNMMQRLPKQNLNMMNMMHNVPKQNMNTILMSPTQQVKGQFSPHMFNRQMTHPINMNMGLNLNRQIMQMKMNPGIGNMNMGMNNHMEKMKYQQLQFLRSQQLKSYYNLNNFVNQDSNQMKNEYKEEKMKNMQVKMETKKQDYSPLLSQPQQNQNRSMQQTGVNISQSPGVNIVRAHQKQRAVAPGVRITPKKTQPRPKFDHLSLNNLPNKDHLGNQQPEVQELVEFLKKFPGFKENDNYVEFSKECVIKNDELHLSGPIFTYENDREVEKQNVNVQEATRQPVMIQQVTRQPMQVQQVSRQTIVKHIRPEIIDFGNGNDMLGKRKRENQNNRTEDGQNKNGAVTDFIPPLKDSPKRENLEDIYPEKRRKLEEPRPTLARVAPVDLSSNVNLMANDTSDDFNKYILENEPELCDASGSQSQGLFGEKEQSFFDSIGSYECRRCVKRIKYPIVLLPCLHTFCSKCVQDIQKESVCRGVRCPKCKTVVTKLKRDLKVENILKHANGLGYQKILNETLFPTQEVNEDFIEKIDKGIFDKGLINEHAIVRYCDHCYISADGYKCNKDTVHVLCSGCELKHVPVRTGLENEQTCSLCHNYYCGTYFTDDIFHPCAIMELGKFSFEILPDTYKQDEFFTALNSVERDFLIKKMYQNNETPGILFRKMMRRLESEKYVDPKYQNAKKNIVCCKICASEIFSRYLYKITLKYKNDADYHEKKKNCSHGRRCTTQFLPYNVKHTRNYNHICEKEEEKKVVEEDDDDDDDVTIVSSRTPQRNSHKSPSQRSSQGSQQTQTQEFNNVIEID